MRYDAGQSDRSVVPQKPPNKAVEPAAEAGEGRDRAKGNSGERNTPRTQGRTGVPSGLERVRQVASRERRQRFTALLHHVYAVDRLRAAYAALKRDAAAGVDGETWRHYGERLEANLQDLAGRLQRGAYRAQPVRRAYIAKTGGRQRPLGVPTLEDKLVQRAVVEVLNAVYEPAFLGFSYGFRPGRSPHHALDALTVGLLRRKVNWVLDADIRSFFDTLEHGWLVKFVEHRMADRRVVRLIQKWLRAGVLEEGRRTQSGEGTVQGGSISPLLANLYLHYVFDLWVHQWRRRQARGDVVVVRFADDFVVGFEHREEAERFLTDLHARFGQFGLTRHPEKTRLIEFGRYAAANRRARGDGGPETFNFLGFTHCCATTRTGGVHGPAADDAHPVAGQAAGGYGRTAAAPARAHPGSRGLPAVGRRRTHPLLRCPDERAGDRCLPRGDCPAVVPPAAAPQSAPSPPVGPDASPGRPVASPCPCLSSVPPGAVWRCYPRQEPDAVAPHVRICGGGGRRLPFLLRLDEIEYFSRLRVMRAAPGPRHARHQRRAETVLEQARKPNQFLDVSPASEAGGRRDFS